MRSKRVATVAVSLCFVLAAAVPGHAESRVMKERGSAFEASIGMCPEGDCWGFKATAKGTPIRDGRFVGTLIQGYDEQQFTNFEGETCWPAVGEGTFKRNQKNQIDVMFEGTSCQVAPDSIRRRFRGFGRVIGGTGDFKGAKGRGALEMRYSYSEEPTPMPYTWTGVIKT